MGVFLIGFVSAHYTKKYGLALNFVPLIVKVQLLHIWWKFLSSCAW